MMVSSSSSFSLSSSSLTIKNYWMKTLKSKASIVALFACSLLASSEAFAVTNEVADAEIEGRELVRQILDMRPSQSLTNSGTLRIRDRKGNSRTARIRCDVVVTATNWFNVYEISGTKTVSFKLVVFHDSPGSKRREFTWVTKEDSDARLPFAGDFSEVDLGLEFFHWPAQKVLKHEMKRGQACKVLESTNPEPSTNGYSRVVSWIDNDTLGIVQAEAYDTKGMLLKEFAPKEFKKVNGQWQLQGMEIRNVQTGSRTRLEFDLDNQ